MELPKRLNEKIVEHVLKLNDGFSHTTHYSGKNIKLNTNWLIENGKLFFKESGKTSWADSHFDEPYREADHGQTLRFLRKFWDLLKSDD